MPGKYDKNSEPFKELLQDFLNFEETGFKPFVQPIGGKDHYRARGDYWENTLEREGLVSTLDRGIVETDHQSTVGTANIARGSGNNNAIDLTGWTEEHAKIEQALLGYKPGELREPYLLEYPTKNKLGFIWGLDGDIEDRSSNRFNMSSDGGTMARSRRVPKERLCAQSLLYGTKGSNKTDGVVTGFGSNDLDVIVLDSAIKKRLENCTTDENGDFWETKEVIDLHFECLQTMVTIEGRAMKTFKVRKNRHGFRWASFWLVGKHAHVAAGASATKRFGGTRVLAPAASPDDASMYSYKTVHSNDVPVKSIRVAKKASPVKKHYVRKGRAKKS